MNHMN